MIGSAWSGIKVGIVRLRCKYINARLNRCWDRLLKLFFTSEKLKDTYFRFWIECKPEDLQIAYLEEFLSPYPYRTRKTSRQSISERKLRDMGKMVAVKRKRLSAKGKRLELKIEKLWQERNRLAAQQVGSGYNDD